MDGGLQGVSENRIGLGSLTAKPTTPQQRGI